MFSTLDFKKYDLESSLDPDERSRIEFDEDVTILIFKQPKRAIVIDTSMANTYLVQMFSLAESLIYYRNSIESNEGLLTRMQAAAAKMSLTDRQSEYLSDILIENRQCIRQAAIYTEVVSGMMNARSTIVNNSVNTLLKKLTLINVIFLPLNLLAGIGGMSEYSAMTEGVPKWASFSLFCLALCGLGWLGWVLLVRFLDKPSG